MEGYVLAWNTGETDDIRALFTDDAVYDPQTAAGEKLGISEILDWWQGIGDEEVEWEFEWLPLLETDDIALVTGKTRYFNPPVSYRNLFVIQFADDDRCADFTEWYIEEEDA